MLTLTTSTPPEQTTFQLPKASHHETQLSDQEIFRRVSRIRSGWSTQERVERRREADRRFEDLLNLLGA